MKRLALIVTLVLGTTAVAGGQSRYFTRDAGVTRTAVTEALRPVEVTSFAAGGTNYSVFCKGQPASCTVRDATGTRAESFIGDFGTGLLIHMDGVASVTVPLASTAAEGMPNSFAACLRGCEAQDKIVRDAITEGRTSLTTAQCDELLQACKDGCNRTHNTPSSQ